MHRHVRFLFVLLAAGCGSTANPPRLTSAQVQSSLYAHAHALDVAGQCEEARHAYEQYAHAVRAHDPASADLALSYARMCTPHAHVDATLSRATTAIIVSDDRQALVLIARDPTPSPWRDYARAVALAGMHRTDEAVRAFDEAARSFPAGDVHARSLALFGKARAYHDAHRCTLATEAYEEYAALVRASDPESAAMAMRYARDCVYFELPRPRR